MSVLALSTPKVVLAKQKAAEKFAAAEPFVLPLTEALMIASK